jgi:hypothetical protein
MMTGMKLITAEATIAKRKATVEKGRLTKARNTALRGSRTGRILLSLERCSSLSKKNANADNRRLTRYLSELQYVCKLADETGIPNGWIHDQEDSFLLGFALSSGEIVFNTFDQRLGRQPFPRRPNAPDNDSVLARAVEQLLREARLHRASPAFIAIA